MTRALPVACLLVCLAVAPLTAADAPHWNQFRGPRGDGAAPHVKNLPVELGEGKHVKWKTPIEGRGWSSPVVWDKQIWLTTAPEDGKQNYAICVNADTGVIVHTLLVFENPNPQFCYPLNSYATPTPVVEDGRVYVHFGVHGTAAIDTKTGQKVWERRDLPCNHFRGPASSPIVHGDLLIVHFDGFDVQYVVALDKRTGNTVWRHDRSFDYQTDDGDSKKAFGTPLVINVNGREQLISPAAVATEALDVKSGDVVWFARTGGMNASARPIFADGVVIVVNGMGQMHGIRSDGSGDVTDTHVEWDLNRATPKRASPVLVDGLLYSVADNGVAACIDPKTGDTIWSERLGGGVEYAASPVYADGRLYFFSMEGDVATVAPGKEFKQLAEGKFDDGFMASPAFVGNAMILRSKTHLYRIDGP